MSTAKPCPSGARGNLGKPVSHPPGTDTGACANWHVEMERLAWERQQQLPAYWDGEGWAALPPEMQKYREQARYRDYRG